MFHSVIESMIKLNGEFKESNLLFQVLALILIVSAGIAGVICAIVWELTITILGGIFYSLLKS